MKLFRVFRGHYSTEDFSGYSVKWFNKYALTQKLNIFRHAAGFSTEK